MVLEHCILVDQLVLEKIHLVLELTEDDPADRLWLVEQKPFYCCELGTCSPPTVSRVAKGFSLARPDVDLGMDGELAELHE